MPPSVSSGVARTEFRARLESLRRKDRSVAVVQGVLLCVAAAVVLLALTSGMEALFWFRPPGRTFLAVSALTVVGALFVWRCGLPLLRPPPDDMLAHRVDRRFPELNDRTTLLLQLWRQHEKGAQPYSAALLDAAIAENVHATRHVDFTAADDRIRIRQAGKTFAIPLLAVSVVFAGLYTPLSASLYRLSHPLTDFPVPSRTRLSVSPGDMEIAAGAPVTFTAEVSGEIPETAVAELSVAGKPWKTVELARLSPTAFSATLHDLTASTEYVVKAGDAESRSYRISVIDHPDIAALGLSYQYPAYTQLAPKTTADGNGDILAVKGTRVRIEVEATQSLSLARIEFDEQESLPMVVAGTKAQANLPVLHDTPYRIILQNREGRANPDPPVYRITAQEDRYPDVMIVAPGRDTQLTENIMVAMNVAGVDDFGFSAMNLVYQKGTEGETSKKFIPIEMRSTTFSVPYVWDLSGLGLFPEDVVTYYVELFDNDAVSGPKRSVSQTYTVRVPSIVEIYEQLENTQQAQVDDLEEMLRTQEEAQEKLRELNRELAEQEQTGNPEEKREMSWEKKKEIETLLSQQEQMAQEVLDAAETLEKAMEQLSEQDMQSMELIEKMNQLRELFKEIATPELMKALKDVREAMKKLDSQQLKESMKDFELEQEEFMKRLERSLSILKRMQTEQEMLAAIRKTEELLKRQEELQYATQEASRNPSEQAKEELSKKQGELSKDAQALQKDIEDLADKMEQIENTPAEGMRDVARSVQRQGLSERMNRIGQQLSVGQMTPASQGQQQVSESLAQTAQQLQQLQEQMESQQREQIAEEMRQAMRQLLKLSLDQESLRDRTTGPGGRNARMQDMAEDQQGLQKGASGVADQLVATAQKSFFISSDIGRALGETLTRMQSASNDLAQRNRDNAAARQTDAMEALNQSVMALQQAMNDMNASGGASGMMEMLQQLQSMAQQQSGINDQLSQMAEGQQSGKKMSMQERAQIARLAAQQEALRKNLEQMQREHREESQIMKRLSEVEREMKETIHELQQQQVDPELVQRQQRILSRLLDASRSMRERDFDEKRMATPGGDDLPQLSPAALPSSLTGFEKMLRDDLLRSMRDGTYPPEYEALIRAYFRSLSDTPREQRQP